jgi:hypothetical protein
VRSRVEDQRKKGMGVGNRVEKHRGLQLEDGGGKRDVSLGGPVSMGVKQL